MKKVTTKKVTIKKMPKTSKWWKWKTMKKSWCKK